MKIKKLLIVQPYLTNYRIPIFRKLSDSYDVNVVGSIKDTYGLNKSEYKENFKISFVKNNSLMNNKLFWQNVFFSFFKYKPDILFLTANPRYLSTWILLIIAKIKSKKVYLHGQGLYNKEKVSISNKIVYNLYNLLCHKYICYTQFSKDSLKDLELYKKAYVAENSITNNESIKKVDSSLKGILFIGRLRKGSNVEFLIKVVQEINNTNLLKEKIYLHIVGDGENIEQLRKEYDSSEINFYGAVYDNKIISKISQKCSIGCYPGDAGLSILHYMSLSLPVVVHGNLKNHMGPEVSYIKNQYNGIFFERNNLENLLESILDIFSSKEKLEHYQINAYNTYCKITTPSLEERFLKIIKEE